MSDTPTPRTDAHMDESIPEGVDKYDLLESFARELERELDEQVLCNGKGAEREADLLGKVERLERENVRLREALEKLLCVAKPMDGIESLRQACVDARSALPNAQAQR